MKSDILCTAQCHVAKVLEHAHPLSITVSCFNLKSLTWNLPTLQGQPKTCWTRTRSGRLGRLPKQQDMLSLNKNDSAVLALYLQLRKQNNANYWLSHPSIQRPPNYAYIYCFTHIYLMMYVKIPKYSFHRFELYVDQNCFCTRLTK